MYVSILVLVDLPLPLVLCVGGAEQCGWLGVSPHLLLWYVGEKAGRVMRQRKRVMRAGEAEKQSDEGAERKSQ